MSLPIFSARSRCVTSHLVTPLSNNRASVTPYPSPAGVRADIPADDGRRVLLFASPSASRLGHSEHSRHRCGELRSATYDGKSRLGRLHVLRRLAPRPPLPRPQSIYMHDVIGTTSSL